MKNLNNCYSETNKDVFGQCEVDPEKLKNNPFLESKIKKGECGESDKYSAKPVEPKVTDLNTVLEFKNIECYDSQKNVFRSYPSIFVAKTVERTENLVQVDNNAYVWMHYFEKQKGSLFLPDLPTTCAILNACYLEKDNNSEARELLMQYVSAKGNNSSHIQNTLIDRINNRILHGPVLTDIPIVGLSENINTRIDAKESVLDYTFAKVSPLFGTPYEMSLDETIQDKQLLKSVQDLTGLKDPSVLIDIGKLGGKKTVIALNNPMDNAIKAAYVGSCIPNNGVVSAIWLSCSDNYFRIEGGHHIFESGPARGVSERK